MRIIFVTSVIVSMLLFPAKAVQSPPSSPALDEGSIPQPVIERAEIPEEKTGEELYREMLEGIADEKGLPEYKIDQIAGTIGGVKGTGCNYGESTWQADAVGDRGMSFGLAQIHIPSHPHITPEQAKDPEFALTFMVDEFQKGNEWKWTCWREIYG